MNGGDNHRAVCDTNIYLVPQDYYIIRATVHIQSVLLTDLRIHHLVHCSIQIDPINIMLETTLGKWYRLASCSKLLLLVICMVITNREGEDQPG